MEFVRTGGTLGRAAPLVKVHRLNATDASAVTEESIDPARGMTLHAYLTRPHRISAGETSIIATGLRVEIPTGFVGMVTSRAGLAHAHSVSVLDAPNLLSPSYDGEIRVVLHNHGGKPFVIHHGSKIAQLIVLPLPAINFVTVGDDDGYGTDDTVF